MIIKKKKINQLITFKKKLHKSCNDEFILVGYCTPKGIRSNLGLHDFPKVEYIGMTGIYYTFLLNGVHGQDAPYMGYCSLKRKK